MDEDIVAEVRMKRNDKKIKEFTLEMMVDDVLDRRVGSYITPIVNCDGKDEMVVRIGLSKHNLAKGKYYLGFNVGMKSEEYEFMDYDIVYGVLSFSVKYINSAKNKEILLWRDDWGRVQFRDGFISIE